METEVGVHVGLHLVVAGVAAGPGQQRGQFLLPGQDVGVHRPVQDVVPQKAVEPGGGGIPDRPLEQRQPGGHGLEHPLWGAPVHHPPGGAGGGAEKEGVRPLEPPPPGGQFPLPGDGGLHLGDGHQHFPKDAMCQKVRHDNILLV